MLKRYIIAGPNDRIETTLSTRSYVSLIRRAHQIGYTVSLFYFWIPSAEVSKARVAQRVSRGGHNGPLDVTERRYSRSVWNLTNLYTPVCDYFTIFDNSTTETRFVAAGGIDQPTDVLEEETWLTIQNYEHS